jgi:hypothetical protein
LITENIEPNTERSSSRSRLMLNLASRLVSGLPSLNFSPSRSLKV